MIPRHWNEEPLSAVGQWGSGGTPRRGVNGYYGGPIPWLKIGDLTDGVVIASDEGITPAGVASSAAKWIPKGAVLIAMYGSIGKLGIAGIPLTTNQAIAHCIPDPERVLGPFLFYWLLSQRSALNRLGKGGTQLNISQTVLRALRMPVPPLEEQRQIIAAIETHSSRLDAAVVSLNRAKANVKRARASVLQAAVDGRLVPAEAELARLEDHAYDAPPAHSLDASLQIEAELPPRRAREGRGQPDIELPRLPSGWRWTTVEQLTQGFTNGLYVPKAKYGRGTPILRIDDFQEGWSRSCSAFRKVEIDDETRERYRLRPGDLVINRVNSITHLGKCICVEERHVPAVFESNMMRAAVRHDCVPRYLALWLTSRPGKNLLLRNAKWAVNQASINQSDVACTPVPLPRLCEQHRIVAEVDRRLSVLDAVDVTIDANLARCARLRQSILQRAFTGRLVPAEPSPMARREPTQRPIQTGVDCAAAGGSR